MIRIRQGQVTKVTGADQEIAELVVLVEGREEKVVNYTNVTGPVQVGDRVVLNTTAVFKSLGTGGQHFVMANLANSVVDVAEPGHIMKLRYTPVQVKCLAAEEEDSPFHEALLESETLEGLPVVVSTLHSMLPLILAGIKVAKPDARIAFVMTDGAALPLAFSKMVKNLKQKQWLDKTITVGHAFGGDLEAVNVYSGLLTARVATKADIAVVGMGPGIVGTGTKFGYTGIEQGEIINAVNVLGGRAVAVPRISFADKRERHRGISHHSITALNKVCLTRAAVVLPKLEAYKMLLVKQQLADSGMEQKHDIVIEDGQPAVEFVQQAGLRVTTMGRHIEQDLEFFLTAGAAGLYAARLV